MRIKISISVDLYTGCVNMPTHGNVKQVCSNRFNPLEEDTQVFAWFSLKGEFCFWAILMLGLVKVMM